MILNRKRRQDGFTLIEAMVAIVIITTGLLMLTHLMVISIVLHERTESDVKSTQLAQAKMESLKAQFSNSLLGGTLPADLVSGSHGPEAMMIQTDEDNNTQNYLYFNVSWNITDLAGGQKQVNLSVSPMSYDDSVDESVIPVSIISVLAP